MNRSGALFLLAEGRSALGRSRRGAIVAVLMTSITIFSAGLFHSFANGLSLLARGWAEEALVVAYLAPGVAATSEAADRVTALIEGSELVVEVRRVSSEAAKDRLLKLYGALAGAADSVNASAFPASIEAELVAEAADQDRQKLIEALAEDPAVEEVQFDRDWVARLDRVARGVRWAGAGLLLLLGSGAALTASGAMRFSLLGARDEIRVLRLVGATETIIRGPYIVAGAIVGLAGAALAMTTLFVLLSVLGRLLSTELPILPSSILPLPGPIETAGFLVFGLLASTVGSWLGSRDAGELHE